MILIKWLLIVLITVSLIDQTGSLITSFSRQIWYNENAAAKQNEKKDSEDKYDDDHYYGVPEKPNLKPTIVRRPSQFTMETDSGNRFERLYLKFLSNLPSANKYPKRSSLKSDNFNLPLTGKTGSSFDQDNLEEKPFESTTNLSPFSRDASDDKPTFTDFDFDFEMTPISSVTKSLLKLPSFTDQSNFWSKNLNYGLSNRKRKRPTASIESTNSKNSEVQASETADTLQIPRYISFGQSRDPMSMTRAQFGVNDSSDFDVSSLESKDCRTIVKKITEIPGIRPKKIVKLIRTRRSHPLFSMNKPANHQHDGQTVTIFMSKDCSGLGNSNSSLRGSPKNMENVPTEITGSETVKVSTQEMSSQSRKKDDKRGRWSLFKPLSMKDDIFKDNDDAGDDDGDNENDNDDGNNVDFKRSLLRSRGSSVSSLINRRYNRPSYQPKSSKGNGISGYMKSSIKNDFEPTSDSMRILEKTAKERSKSGSNQRLHLMPSFFGNKKPKIRNKTSVYFKSNQPVKLGKGLKKYSISYGQENIQSYSEDYDSERDGTTGETTPVTTAATTKITAKTKDPKERRFSFLSFQDDDK